MVKKKKRRARCYQSTVSTAVDTPLGMNHDSKAQRDVNKMTLRAHVRMSTSTHFINLGGGRPGGLMVTLECY